MMLMAQFRECSSFSGIHAKSISYHPLAYRMLLNAYLASKSAYMQVSKEVRELLTTAA